MGDKLAKTYYDVDHCALRLTGTLILYKGQVAWVTSVRGGRSPNLEDVTLTLKAPPYVEETQGVPLLSEDVSLHPFTLGYIYNKYTNSFVYSHRNPLRTANQGLNQRAIVLQGQRCFFEYRRASWLEALNDCVQNRYPSPVLARRNAKRMPGSLQAISRDFAFRFEGQDSEGASRYLIYYKWFPFGHYHKSKVIPSPRFKGTFVEELFREATRRK